ncbi:MAG: SusC/RagA family TonB-linked outer membrane protein [Bacteroidales bacterium]|nr:SusC/RagA family TonB-linked outer membrane protein [Bacteroidales bacterium]
MKMRYTIVLALSAAFCVTAAAQDVKFEKRVAETGLPGVELTEEESTAAVSVITADQIGHRTTKNIGNSIIGQGQGLISLQGAGNVSDMNPTFYVRGLQTLNGNSTPLILIDGIERPITNVAAEEVESVTILKDAAAVALYGYKGANGAILLTTKRGEYNTRTVKFTYDHMFNSLVNKPRFVDGYTYALATNEARINDGYAAQYSGSELDAFRSNKYPYLYPNVNWVDETFKNTASTNNFNMEFSGGQGRFRYFAMLDLIADKGFINGSEVNEGYSTQDKYVRGNLRLNMDLDLTPTTDLRLNLLGMLLEDSRPGSNINPWDMVYTIPSSAFPIRDGENIWAGSSNTAWPGTKNPVAQTRGAAYYKNHNRSLFMDLTVKQDLSDWAEGLSAYVRASYDNLANMYENHSKTYVYHYLTPTWADGASEPTWKTTSAGTDSAMGTGAGCNDYFRHAHVDAGLNYDFSIDESAFKTQLRYDFDYEDRDGTNQSIYRHSIGLWGHYNYGGKFLADLVLMENGSSRLAPGTKWNFSPTLSLAWVISGMDAVRGSDWVNYLKLRASAGLIHADYLPGNNVWSYYAQGYTTGGSGYPLTSAYSSEFGATALGQLATANPSNERALKSNFGVDGRLFDGLTFNVDAYWQRRSNIWVDAAGKYSAVIGKTAPYENGGIVDSYGFELGLNYNVKLGDVVLDYGGNFNLNRNKIVDMLEEPRMFDNLVQTGNPVSQLYGLKAVGFFKDEADIAASPAQNFSVVRPGDIKYEDVNKDGVVDENDVAAIGYSTTAPQIYYNFHLGAEWKGLGFYALFQGVAKYSAMLNTKAMYQPRMGYTSMSQYYYDNRWTPGNTNALYPRLTSENDSPNNYQNNTVFLADRSFLKLRNVEVYYNFPASLLERTRFIKGVKVYASGNDLFSFDKLPVSDPEAYGTAQLFRSIVAGVSLTF